VTVELSLQYQISVAVVIRVPHKTEWHWYKARLCILWNAIQLLMTMHIHKMFNLSSGMWLTLLAVLCCTNWLLFLYLYVIEVQPGVETWQRISATKHVADRCLGNMPYTFGWHIIWEHTRMANCRSMWRRRSCTLQRAAIQCGTHQMSHVTWSKILLVYFLNHKDSGRQWILDKQTHVGP